jgi:hypothetical protein
MVLLGDGLVALFAHPHALVDAFSQGYASTLTV